MVSLSSCSLVWALFVLIARCYAQLSSSASGSQSASPSLTPSASPAWSVVFDGTAQLSLPISSGLGFVTVLNSSILTAISFYVTETSLACGPGQWSLTRLTLPLSQFNGAAASIFTVQIFQANVRINKYSSVAMLCSHVLSHVSRSLRQTLLPSALGSQ